MADRITTDLAKRSFHAIHSDIGQRPVFKQTAAKFAQSRETEASKRRRVVLLNLGDPEEAAFWQILMNRKDKFDIISQKESHQRQEYVSRVIFDEKGDELPIIKTQEEFINEYVRMPDV